MVSTLAEQILVTEESLHQIRTGNQDVPSSTKEDLDGTMLTKWLLNVLPVRFLLVNVEEEWEKSYPEWNGWDVAGVSRRAQEHKVDSPNDDYGKEQKLDSDGDHDGRLR